MGAKSMLRTNVEDVFELTPAEESVREEFEKGLSLLAATHLGGGAAKTEWDYWFQNQQGVDRSVKNVLAKMLATLPQGTTLCIR